MEQGLQPNEAAIVGAEEARRERSGSEAGEVFVVWGSACGFERPIWNRKHWEEAFRLALEFWAALSQWVRDMVGFYH